MPKVIAPRMKTTAGERCVMMLWLRGCVSESASGPQESQRCFDSEDGMMPSSSHDPVKKKAGGKDGVQSRATAPQGGEAEQRDRPKCQWRPTGRATAARRSARDVVGRDTTLRVRVRRVARLAGGIACRRRRVAVGVGVAGLLAR